jgi:hypothetical protein
MASFKELFLDEKKVRNGVKMSLFNRDGGISKEWLMIKWSWSDEVRATLDELKRQGEDEYSKDGKINTKPLIIEGILAHIASWSYDEKLTKANLRMLLKARPDLADRIDSFAANTKLFFTDSGASSSPGPKTK